MTLIVTLTPEQRYQQDVANGLLFEDSAQRAAVAHFQRLYEALQARQGSSAGALGRLLPRWFGSARHTPVKGLYVYGGVGRGKTYLMDVFYESLPFPDKMRTHFHRFMQRVHAELAQLTQQKNPLELVARRIAGEARIGFSPG